MREARNWFARFFPESSDDVTTAMLHPDSSAFYRMVVTYWDMAASFVNRGAIDEDMFFDSANEAFVVFSKVQPYVAGLRELMGNPNYLKHLDDLIMRQPKALEMLEQRRELMKRWMQARAEMAKSA